MTTHSSAGPKAAQRDRALALGLGLLLFAVYLLGYRGGFHSVDEVSMFAVAESLVKFGRLDTDQIAWTQWTTSQSEAQGFFGVDGHVYSKKGLATSLAIVPLYWLGWNIPGLGMLQTASLLNPIVTALTAGLLFLLIRRLGYNEEIAMGVAGLYGLATIAWVYTKYLFSEPLAGLFLLAAAYLLVAYRQAGGAWRAALAGLCAGLAVTSRANNLFLVPVFAAYLLVASDWPNGWMNRWKIGRSVLYFLLGLLPPALVLMGYNWLRAGNPLQTGYDLTLFSSSVPLGLYKLLFSPLRGLFIFSPLLILSIPGLAWLWPGRRAETGLIVGVSGLTLLLFSIWASGEGLSWGARFLVPIVPFLCLGLAPVVERALGGSRLLAGLLFGLTTISLFIQFLGIAINPWVYLAQLQTAFGGEFFLENTPALTGFGYSPVIGQLRNRSLANSDVAWWQPGFFDGLALGLALLLVLAAGANIKYQIANGKSANSKPWLYSIITILFAVLITYSLLTRYYLTDERQFGPRDDVYTRALDAAAGQAAPGDRIVTVAPSHYHVPMNRFKARIPLVGFAQQRPPLPDTALPLLQAALQGPNTWLVTVGFAPAAADNAAEQWLSFHAFKASDEWLGNARLARYGVEDPMATRSINARLGKELELESVRLPEAPARMRVLAVEFIWVALERPSADYNLFLQLLAADGRPIAQHDGPPGGGYLPTSGWPPGQPIADRHGLILSADLPPGSYRMIAGMVDPISGQRLAVPTGGDFVDLGTVVLP